MLHEHYMQRCLDLAKLGAGYTAPNPMVGSVLVYEDKIIGEGYHKKYGEAHAEVNCISSVAVNCRHLINISTLYVSLEPCAHYGKTPPCSDLIIKNKIPKVVIGCEDPFNEVNGKGIAKLRSAGVETIVGVLEKKCRDLNKRFFTFQTKQRPYIILKWAQTANKKIAVSDNKRLIISNILTNRMVHRWRSEEAAILVGTNTALLDNPELTNRFWTGNNPVRLVIDKNLKLTENAKIFNQKAATIIFNLYKMTLNFDSELVSQVYYFKLDKSKDFITQIINCCFRLNLTSILVEGGTQLLQHFIDEGLYDETRIITNESLKVENGLNSPELKNGREFYKQPISSDNILFSYN